MNEWRDLVLDQDMKVVFYDGLDKAVVGIFFNEQTETHVAVYSIERCIEIFMQRDGMSHEDATEFFFHNTFSTYIGDATPIFVTTPPRSPRPN